MTRLPLALLALALAGSGLVDAGPARADAPGAAWHGPARHGHAAYGREGMRRRPVHRHRFARAPGRVALAPPAGPAYWAWPEPAEVRVPIYNRPHHRPPVW